MVLEVQNDLFERKINALTFMLMLGAGLIDVAEPSNYIKRRVFHIGGIDSN